MGIDIARKCKLECKLPGNAAEKNDVREKNVDIQSNKKNKTTTTIDIKGAIGQTEFPILAIFIMALAIIESIDFTLEAG